MAPWRRRHDLTAALAAGAVAAAVLTATSPSSGSAVAAAPEESGHALPEHSVTLVTGDRVLLAGDAVLRVEPGDGRAGMAFAKRVDGEDTSVIPADVAPLVAAGQVDDRLFDVSLLVRAGYDDAHRDDVPLIVTHRPGARMPSAVPEGRALPSVGGSAIEVAKADTDAFWAAVSGPRALSGGVTQVWLDGPVRPSLDRSVAQVGAPEAWAAGFTGAGATVAVLDTGVDATHPDLAGAVVEARDFSGSPSGAGDVIGHGTHVAGTITGDGSASGGRYKGVAPDATLLNGKVIADDGWGQDSWIISGMEWAAARADVVNMSLGSGMPSDGLDPMSQAVNRLTEETGALFVIAAGNEGPQKGTVASPAAADAALTVGAVDANDHLAPFSNRGPRAGDGAIKPDIVAPGVDIVAPLAKNAQVGEQYPVVDGQYVQLSGTSMATPHVAGAAAILAAQHTDWDAHRIKPALMSSAGPKDGMTAYEQGAGRLDVARAVEQQVTVTPPSFSGGLVAWPHGDDAPKATTLTYRNPGTAPVSLDLAVDIRGPGGVQAPAGMFTLSASSVTVPAGGTADVVLTQDTRVAGPDGAYEGRVVATGGGNVVRTVVAVDREVESHDVAITVLDRDGRPSPHHFVALQALDTPWFTQGADPSGTLRVRVPKGRYLGNSYVTTQLPDGTWNYTVFYEPAITVDGPEQLVFDARQAVPTGTTYDRPEADTYTGEVGLTRQSSHGPITFGMVADPDLVLARPSETSAPGEFTFHVVALAARPDGTGGFDDSPYLYHSRWVDESGGVPADPERHVPDSAMATEDTRIAATASGQWAERSGVFFSLPATTVARYSPGVAWDQLLRVYDRFPSGGGAVPFPVSGQVAQAVEYSPGRPRTRLLNAGVFGPAFPPPLPRYGNRPWAGRDGDTIDYTLQLYSDAQPTSAGTAYLPGGRTALYRDDQLVGESGTGGSFAVPAGTGAYRLEASLRQTAFRTSTDISATWTFRSGTGTSALPLTAIRFAPALDDQNRARGDCPFAVPLTLQRQTGAPPAQTRTLEVQVSYDEGRTWKAAKVTGRGESRQVHLRHPAGPGSVSLKAKATDTSGNTVTQTILRAYELV